MMAKLTALFVVVVAVVPFHAAVGADVYVNGVNVEGLTSHTFEKVTVRIDDKGDVYIDAPGYTIKRVTLADKKAPAAPEATMTQKYFLVTEQNVQGLTEYDVAVHLNGTFVRTVSSRDPQLVADVTRYVRPGKNLVMLDAKKKLEDPQRPKSTAKAHLFRVIIGEGHVKDDQVVIEKQMVSFTRTAHDTDNVAQEYSFTTR